jgi:YNFM family putative membrane transporter
VPAADPDLRRLKVAMLAAGLAAFSLLYFTQALLPALSRSFRVSATTSTLSVSVATGALAVALLPMSSLAETLGRVRTMKWCLSLACLLAFASAAAPSFWVLLVLRALLGGCLAGVISVAVGHLADEAPAGTVGSLIGLYVSGNSLGGIAGRLVPGLAQQFFSWRISVVLLACCASVATAVFVTMLPAARQAVVAPTGLAHQLASLRSLWADRGIRRLCAVAFLIVGGFVACFNYLTFRLIKPPLNLSPSVASLLFLAYLAGTASAPVAGRLADSLGRRRLVVAALLVSLAGLLLTLVDDVAVIVLGLLILTAGFFATHATASGWVSARAAGGRAQGAAMYLMAYYIGSSTLGSAAGVAYRSQGWGGVVAVVACGLVLAILVTPRRECD